MRLSQSRFVAYTNMPPQQCSKILSIKKSIIDNQCQITSEIILNNDIDSLNIRTIKRFKLQ